MSTLRGGDYETPGKTVIVMTNPGASHPVYQWISENGVTTMSRIGWSVDQGGAFHVATGIRLALTDNRDLPGERSP